MPRIASALASRRTRLVAGLLAGLVLLAVLLVVVLRSLGDDAPEEGASRLVPADALVLLSVSTDSDRDGTKRATELLERFPSFPGFRDGLIERLRRTGRGTGVDYRRDIRPWLGDEVALAVFDTDLTTATATLIASVTDRARADEFLQRLGPPTSEAEYKGETIRSYGGQAVGFAGGRLVAGPLKTIRTAIDLAAAGGKGSLAQEPAFARARAGAPDSRLASLWISQGGLRRLLAPAGGLVGLAGTVLDQPALLGLFGSLTADEEDRLRLRLDSALGPAPGGKKTTLPAFAPGLPEVLPAATLAYFGVGSLRQIASRLVTAGAASGVLGDAGALLQRAGQQIAASGVNLQRQILPLFSREVAFGLLARPDANPALLVVSEVEDEAAAEEAFSALQAPLARLFSGAASDPGGGQAPVFSQEDVGGVRVTRLQLSTTLELAYAVNDGRLLIATGLDGIDALLAGGDALAADGAFEGVTSGRPEDPTALLFLDFSQLLDLGERTGLDRDPRYTAARADLRRVRAAGLTASRGDGTSTVEMTFSIR